MGLILTVCPGESVLIGSKVKVKLTHIKGKRAYIREFSPLGILDFEGGVGVLLLDRFGVKLTVLEIKGSQVRLHFEADASIRILREKLLISGRVADFIAHSE